MKKIIFFLFLLSNLAIAQDMSHFRDQVLNVCEMGQGQLTKVDSDRYSDDSRDFTANDKYKENWECLMLKQHINRDSLKNCLPSELSPRREGSQTIEGTIRYMGLKKEPYKYDAYTDSEGKTRIEVRIHFKGELGEDEKALSKTKEKLNYASVRWTKDSPDKKIRFIFKAVSADENPHFSVKLQNRTFGTKYNSIWGINDSRLVVTHEVGHMLGLDDEYKVIRSTIWQVKNPVDSNMCNLRGIMCDFYRVEPIYPYYYYLILRRLSCES